MGAGDVTNDVILEIWRSRASGNCAVPIIPDGCRDLIFRHLPGEQLSWFVSDLADETYEVSTTSGDYFLGFRLQPGIRIDEQKLLASLHARLTEGEICDRLDNFTSHSRPVAQALNCLAFEAKNIAEAARLLGTSQRCLQRLLIRETGRSPVYWLQLARIRRVGRILCEGALVESRSLAECAALAGYADQAHMSREFRRWFGISPSMLKVRTAICQQLVASGYGATTGVQISTRKPFSSLT